MNLSSTASRFPKDVRALAAVEFALVLPVFLLVVFGIVELTRYTLIIQKIQKNTFTIADLITQGEKVCTKDISDLMSAAVPIMLPYKFNNVSVVFSSMLSRPLAFPPVCAVQNFVPTCVVWKEQRTNGTVADSGSRVGNVGDRAIIPNGAEAPPGSNYILVETFYTFTPLLDSSAILIPMLTPRVIYTVAMMKPRLGNLDTYNGDGC